MAISSVSTSPSPPSSAPRARLVQSGFSGLPSAEATRLVLRLLGIGAIGAGTVAFGAAALGLTAGAVGLLVIPCGLVATGAIWYSLQFDDYENPEELEKFQREAVRVPLEQVVRQHGWNSMLHWGLLTPEQFEEKFRFQLRGKSLGEIITACESAERHIAQCLYPRYDYHIPAPSEWRRQWTSETGTKTFEQILAEYPLDKLEKYNILEVGELHKIKELKGVHDRIKQESDAQIAQIDREFTSRTESYQRAYQADCAAADSEFNSHPAIRQLRDFEMNYVRERNREQDIANQSRTNARNRFEEAIRPITREGQVPYSRLTPEQKALYDQHDREMQLRIHEADNRARAKFAEIDARCAAEKARLLAEEHGVKEVRARRIEESKVRYDAAILPARQRKDEQLAPIQARFRSAVSDLNGRYRAYLRTIGAVR